MSLVHIYMRITGKLLFTLLLTVAVSAYGQSMSDSPADQAAEENLAQLKMVAESGDANAQYDLAWMYDTGGDNKILAKDTRKAAEWYEKAAVQGHVKAQAGLGMLYSTATVYPKDYVKAVDWLQKASAQGMPMQLNLGWLCRDGKGIPKDPAKAFGMVAECGRAWLRPRTIFPRGNIQQRRRCAWDVAKALEFWGEGGDAGDILMRS
ncbi:MAG: sel1 repeat family protein [Nitrosomonadales bacterium]|nr:sel1 repeat family protein [Nitrosomonadales bacterium]